MSTWLHFPRRPFPFLSKRHLTVLMDTEAPGTVEASIRQKLDSLLQPTSLTIVNDSWKHRHHAPMREQAGNNGETRILRFNFTEASDRPLGFLDFSILVVSNAFQGMSLTQRHRMIYSALSEEFSAGLHALSLKAKTEDEESKAPSFDSDRRAAGTAMMESKLAQKYI